MIFYQCKTKLTCEINNKYKSKSETQNLRYKYKKKKKVISIIIVAREEIIVTIYSKAVSEK